MQSASHSYFWGNKLRVIYVKGTKIQKICVFGSILSEYIFLYCIIMFGKYEAEVEFNGL